MRGGEEGEGSERVALICVTSFFICVTSLRLKGSSWKCIDGRYGIWRFLKCCEGVFSLTFNFENLY